MMSVISMENNVTKMKQKLLSNDPVKEEARSFLNFSREKLNISQEADPAEQGYNRSRLRPSRNTILSSVALLIAVLCLSLEGWKLQCSRSNAREIEQLKRDVDDLKNRFLHQSIINKLKVLGQQLYGGMSTDNDDPSEADIDYDSNYDDDDDDNDYSTEYYALSTHASKSSDLAESTSTSTSEPNKTIVEMLTPTTETSTKRQDEFGKDADRVEEEHKTLLTEEKFDNSNNTKYKRDIVTGDTMSTRHVGNGTSKTKRFVNDRSPVVDDTSVDTIKYQHGEQFRAKMTTFMDLDASDRSDTDDSEEGSTLYTNERLETSSDGKTDWRLDDVAENRSNEQKRSQNSKKVSKKSSRKLTRRNLRVPRQIRAIHYGADSTLFSVNDEHTGNGRARHSSGIFKAWRASDWVADLGMDRFFSLATDGKLTVNEAGLYLAYAQIHYLDEHDENGFHLLVNDRPVLQCMVFSPGTGHKSRSCFSAQVTFLRSGDHLILKDVGSARYTLFQHDKSFFGLVKLGEARYQRHSKLTP